MQTVITGIFPVRRYRLWLHRRSLSILDRIPSTVLVAVTDFHAICTSPASLLHTRELRCCNEGHGSQGESAAAGGVARLRQAGAFLLKSNPPARYPSL